MLVVLPEQRQVGVVQLHRRRPERAGLRVVIGQTGIGLRQLLQVFRLVFTQLFRCQPVLPVVQLLQLCRSCLNQGQGLVSVLLPQQGQVKIFRTVLDR